MPFHEIISKHIIRTGADDKIYLTFDDGPSPQCTPAVLDLLRANSVPATFFVQGSQAEKYPALLMQIVNAGHQVGNHGYWHRPHWFCSRKFVRESVVRTNSVLEKYTGARIRLFRPPFGRIGVSALRVCHELEMKIVLWNLMPHDYRSEVDTETITRRIEKRLKPRRIIVLHDNLAVPDKLISSLPRIIKFVRDAGFEFGRVR